MATGVFVSICGTSLSFAGNSGSPCLSKATATAGAVCTVLFVRPDKSVDKICDGQFAGLSVCLMISLD